MEELSVILSIIAVIISGCSFWVSYRAYILNKNSENKNAYVIISNLLLHYNKNREHYKSGEIYFQVDFLFDIVPITGNATTLTGDKTWILKKGKGFDNYFHKYYTEIQNMKDEIMALHLYTKSKKILYLKDFSLKYLEYIETIYCQYKTILNEGFDCEQAMTNSRNIGLINKFQNLEKMYKIIKDKKYFHAV